MLVLGSNASSNCSQNKWKVFCELIKYWNNLRAQQSIFSARFYCALLTLHVILYYIILYYYTGCGNLTSFFEYEMPYEKGSYLATPCMLYYIF
jgi:hypothetical protein